MGVRNHIFFEVQKTRSDLAFMLVRLKLGGQGDTKGRGESLSCASGGAHGKATHGRVAATKGQRWQKLLSWSPPVVAMGVDLDRGGTGATSSTVARAWNCRCALGVRAMGA